MPVPDTPALFQIRIKGHLNERRLHCFEGLSIVRHPGGETSISGAMDQAALHGILNRIRDLAMDLISVSRQTCPDDFTSTEKRG